MPLKLAPVDRVCKMLVVGVQYTFDDVFASNYSAASGNWTDHPSLTAQTATKDANVAYPVSGLRIKQTAGNGSVRCTFIQAGGGGLS